MLIDAGVVMKNARPQLQGPGPLGQSAENIAGKDRQERGRAAKQCRDNRSSKMGIKDSMMNGLRQI
jgi:hypothetical protein